MIIPFYHICFLLWLLGVFSVMADNFNKVCADGKWAMFWFTFIVTGALFFASVAEH